MKKSEALNGILDDIEKYVQDKNNNFGKKMKEYRKMYDLTQICGLIESFLKYQYDNDSIPEYIQGEIVRYNSVCSMFQMEKVELTKDEIDFITNKTEQFCKILFK